MTPIPTCGHQLMTRVSSVGNLTYVRNALGQVTRLSGIWSSGFAYVAFAYDPGGLVLCGIGLKILLEHTLR